MTNRLSARKSTLLIIVIAAVIASITFISYSIIDHKENLDVTAVFMDEYMRNDNGTTATYLKPAPSEHPDIVAGREALSESLGLWMQYAVLSEDQIRFEDNVRLLTTYFLDQNPKPYIRWKLQPDGQAEVTTNALGDDLRILDALLKAYKLWGQEEYLQLAKDIGASLKANSQTDGYFVDYHDFKRNESAAVLSLVYVDISALREMRDNEILTASDYEGYEDLLLRMPSSGVFFPKTCRIASGQYEYDTSINLIDQLILGIHLAEMGHPPKELMLFLKEEFLNNQRLYGRYDRETRKPGTDYESPAVYGLAMILAIKTDDLPWAEQLYDRMIQFRGQDRAYPGGYVFDGNTHAFDNLFPLLAETQFTQARR